MNALFALTLLLIVAYIHCDDSSNSFKMQLREKRHSGKLDKYSDLKDKKGKKDIQSVIDAWNENGATTRDHAGRVHKVRSARIDFQSTYNVDDQQFHIYAVQISSKMYSEVHIETGVVVGKDLIQAAFEKSRDQTVHVFFTKEGGKINEPKDKNSYVSGVITRHLSGQEYKVVVWSTNTVVNYLSRKFNNTPI